MNNSRPVILLCWGYSRPGWIRYFEQMNNEFEFVYLFYFTKEEETAVHTSNRRIYYRDFSSPRQLLSSSPFSKVIFMGLDGLQTISLNIQAKKMGIPALYMMHGSATISVDDYHAIQFSKRNLLREIFKRLGSWVFTFRFMVSALGPSSMRTLSKLLLYQYRQTRMHPVMALKKTQLKERIPDKYIVFSRLDIPYYAERDGASPDRFIVLGNIEVTGFVEYAKQHKLRDGNYLLYIETPLSAIDSAPFDSSILTKEEYNLFWKSLSEQARNVGLRLKVKLHPYSYANTWLYKDDNIDYYTDASIEELVFNSTLVMGYDSSLLVPSLVYKKVVILIVSKPDTFQQNVINSNAVFSVPLESLHNEPDYLRDVLAAPDKSKDRFIDWFIAPNQDGKALTRLSEILAG